MKNIFILLGIVALFTSYSNAQMKCAAGKCGSSMSGSEKQDVKLLYKGNTAYKAIDIKANEYSCVKCKMDVKALDYATQVVKKNGDTYFFDDVGCMVLWLKEHATDSVKRYVRTLDTHRWIEAEKAHYSRIAPSPMGYGFGAVEASKEGLVSYEEMRDLMLKGLTLRDPAVKKKLLP
ncbi:MAG TPA: hypothetical protein ENJ71_03230 [Epsilonproteobacteria bacterium]|nr:hypothetical protein [Campylobacterota bacterium]